MPTPPPYLAIAKTLKAEVLAGDYDADGLPGTATIAERFGVNLKTAGRAVQQLAAEGVVIARPGQSAVPAPPELRTVPPPQALEEIRQTSDPATRARQAGDQVVRIQAIVGELSRIRREALDELVEAGLTQTQIADQVGLTRARVGQILGANPRADSPSSPSEDRELAAVAEAAPADSITQLRRDLDGLRQTLIDSVDQLAARVDRLGPPVRNASPDANEHVEPGREEDRNRIQR